MDYLATASNAIELAGCVIQDEHERLLLLHRLVPEQWEIPGGKREPGEDCRGTAIRENQQELDIKIAIVDEIGTAEFHERGKVYRYTWFTARIVTGSPVPMEDKFDKIGYFTKEDLRMLSPISTGIKILLEKFGSKLFPI